MLKMTFYIIFLPLLFSITINIVVNHFIPIPWGIFITAPVCMILGTILGRFYCGRLFP